MMKFSIRRIVPPGGYPYLVPETGVIVKGCSLLQTAELAMKHLRANNLPVPGNLPELIEDSICRNCPPGFCYGDPEGKPVARTATLSTIKEATLNMVVKGGRVSPGVARNRLDICGECPHNDRRICTTCNGLGSWARKLVGTTCPRDTWLGVCSVDATALAAKIHVATIKPDENYPAACWVAKGE